MSRPAPYVRLNGRRLSTTAKDRATVIAPLTITWGGDTGEGQPDPSNAKVSFLFRDTMGDLPDLAKGAEIEVNDPVRPNYIITGKVQTMTAQPETRVDGSLVVDANVIDHTAFFENEYAQIEWPASTNRYGQLFQLMQSKGYSLNCPRDSRESSREVLNSIKVSTLLQRYTSRFRGRQFDTTWRDADHILHKQVSVIKGSKREVSPDRLDARVTGWFRRYVAPTVDGVQSPVVVLSASNLLNDPKWRSSPEDAVTAVKLATVTQGDNGFSETEDHNYRADTATVDRLGLRSIDVETDLENALDWQPTAAQYFNDDAPWRTEALTIRDTDLLSDDDFQTLIDRYSRYRTLVIIEGIAQNRPDPGTTILRSYLAGGSFTWTGEKWEITLNLERTILKLDGEGDWWTFERVAASSNLLISEASFESVGDNLSFADFRFIGEP